MGAPVDDEPSSEDVGEDDRDSEGVREVIVLSEDMEEMEEWRIRERAAMLSKLEN